jgi:hypothetical protein
MRKMAHQEGWEVRSPDFKVVSSLSPAVMERGETISSISQFTHKESNILPVCE